MSRVTAIDGTIGQTTVTTDPNIWPDDTGNATFYI
jgi:hypothetical protein